MNHFLSKRSMIVIIVLLVVFLFGLSIMSQPQPPTRQVPLTDIQSIGTLQTQFNQDAGKTRLIILVSPT